MPLHRVAQESLTFNMVTKHADINELIAQLRTHYEDVQAKAAFLALKLSELRPGNEVSFFGFHGSREQLLQEHSLLAGHAHLVQETITREKIAVATADQRFLKDIAAFSRQQMARY